MLTGLGLAVWQTLKPSRKRALKLANVTSAVLGALLGILLFAEPWRARPVPTSGALRPRFQADTGDTSGIRYRVDMKTKTWVVSLPRDRTVQPFGPLVPLSMRQTSQGVYVSMLVYDLDGTAVGIVKDNRWQVYPGRAVRYSFDESTLEILGRYDIPLLQFEYRSPSVFRLLGVFSAQADSTQLLYDSHQFASAPDTGYHYSFIHLPEPGLWVLGAEDRFPFSKRRTVSERGWEGFLARARQNLRPWFN